MNPASSPPWGRGLRRGGVTASVEVHGLTTTNPLTPTLSPKGEREQAGRQLRPSKVGTVRCAVPVAERSVRRRKRRSKAVIHHVRSALRSAAGGDGPTVRPYPSGAGGKCLGSTESRPTVWLPLRRWSRLTVNRRKTRFFSPFCRFLRSGTFWMMSSASPVLTGEGEHHCQRVSVTTSRLSFSPPDRPKRSKPGFYTQNSGFLTPKASLGVTFWRLGVTKRALGVTASALGVTKRALVITIRRNGVTNTSMGTTAK
jgi:hypothetical protein